MTFGDRAALVQHLAYTSTYRLESLVASGAESISLRQLEELDKKKEIERTHKANKGLTPLKTQTYAFRLRDQSIYTFMSENTPRMTYVSATFNHITYATIQLPNVNIKADLTATMD